MHTYIQRVFKARDTGFLVKTKWIEAFTLAHDLVAVWAEVVVTIPGTSRTIIIDPLRVTGVLRDSGEPMEIVHWHASVPDVSSDSEIWPGLGEPKWYEEISVLFTDFVGFSNMVSTMPAKMIVHELNRIFTAFDEIISSYHVDKIKTIGDSYMAASGLAGNSDHASLMVRATKEMHAWIEQYNETSSLKWEMRSGIHSGPVIGGIIGTQKLNFDLWGDTVNLASRMESASVAGRINLSAYTYELIKQNFSCEYRGKIDTKDKGKLEMYFVV